MKKEDNVCRGTAASESLFGTDTAGDNVSASSGSQTHHTATYRPDKRWRFRQQQWSRLERRRKGEETEPVQTEKITMANRRPIPLKDEPVVPLDDLHELLAANFTP